jgi:hypothetical protein
MAAALVAAAGSSGSPHASFAARAAKGEMVTQEMSPLEVLAIGVVEGIGVSSFPFDGLYSLLSHENGLA